MEGVDISSPTGTPVHAAADGIVARSEYYGGYGKLVVIDHGNGMSTRYGHLSRFNVVPGQEVRRGAKSLRIPERQAGRLRLTCTLRFGWAELR